MLQRIWYRQLNGKKRTPVFHWRGTRRSASEQEVILKLASSALIAAALLIPAGCSKEATETEPIVTVQASPVPRATIERIVSTEAVVFALHQAVITPKIS